MNVASTFNYMTSVGNKDGTVENVVVSKDVKNQELGPEGTGYGSDGDSSKKVGVENLNGENKPQSFFLTLLIKLLRYPMR